MAWSSEYLPHLRAFVVFTVTIGATLSAQAQSQVGPGELGAYDTRILTLWGEGKMAEGIPIRKQALAIAEKTLGSDNPRTIEYAHDLGDVLKLLGRHDEAMPYLERATKAQERLLSKKKGATPEDYTRLAALYQSSEQYARAEYVYKQVVALQEKLLGPAHEDVARTLGWLAFVYGAQERHAEEALVRKRELAIREKLVTTDPMGGLQLWGVITVLIDNYEVLGRYGEAEALARRAIASLEKDPITGALTSSAVAQLGRVFAAQGRYAEAEPLLRRAIALERKQPPTPGDNISPYFTLGFFLNELANVQYKLGRLDDAEKAAREALPIFNLADKGKEDAITATSLTSLARIQQARGRHDEAGKLYGRALALARTFRGQESTQVAHLLGDMASLRKAEGKAEEAHDFARRATGMLIRKLRLNAIALGMTPNGQARPSNFFHQPTFSIHLSAAAELASRFPDRAATLAAESFEIAQWAQHSQAAISLSQMAARFSKGDGELAQLIRQRQDLVASYTNLERNQIAAHAKSPDQRSQGQEESWRKSSEAIEKRIEEINGVLPQKFPDYAALANPEPLPVRDLQATLRADEALFQFFSDQDQSFAWVVTREAVRWRTLPLGTAGLAREVAALRCGLDASSDPKRCAQLLGTGVRQDAGLPFDLARSHALYQALLSPFEDMIRGRHLLFVPSGPLTTLPPQVLVASPPDASLAGMQAYARAAWLGTRQPVTLLPSVSSLKSLRTAARTSAATNPFAAFANPLLTGASGTDRSAWSRQSCAPADGGKAQLAALAVPRGTIPNYYRGAFADVDVIRRQAPLPETADEVCFVANDLKAAPEAVYLGANATEAKIKALSAGGMLKSYRVLHFATHGLVAGETRTLTANQAEPALLLTPPQTASAEDDGLLTASEVAKLSLDADWVILSACNTASADGTPGAEALSGLASAFLYAGTRSLIVSHWYVNSEAAVKLITGIFGEMRKQPGMPRAEAMRRSIAARILEGGARAHPAYWAPFVIVGESG